MSNYSVSLVGPAPWGFRLQGGKDFNMPLTISKLTDGGKAAKASIVVGDVVLSIDGISTNGMTHLEAQNKIKACTGSLNLTLQKSSGDAKHASVPKDEPQEIFKPSPLPTAPKITPSPSAAYNKTAKPFEATAAPKVASIPSASSAFTPASTPHSFAAPPPPTFATAAAPPPPAVYASTKAKPILEGHMPPPSAAKVTVAPSVNVPPQPSVYNTPIHLYSNNNACEVAEGQRRGLNQRDAAQHNGGPPSILKAPRKHIVDTDIEFNHVPTHGDASKKRLIEDTEDWHPRTGTSQSRSFRILAQITGTERMQEQETDSSKKNDAVELLQPSTHVTSSVKTMTKAPGNIPRPSPGNVAPVPAFKSTAAPVAAKSAGWQLSNAAASGFQKDAPNTGHITYASGHVSNSSLQYGAKAHPANTMSRPAPQPHPKDQDTLIQRAEHIPAGTRTPMCGHCKMVIRGPFLVAMGKSWHPEEFTCAHCKTSLADIGFVEEKGSVYCEHCYEEFFAPTCGRCQLKILGEIINALKQTWHVHCFLCTSCHQPIRNNVFHLEDGEPYCEQDYYNMFGTSCHGCDFPIEAGDKFLEALGYIWHDTCFVCSVCSTNLEGQTFFSKKDKPLCKKHAHSINM
ncbi:PDZ and LIM domain protein 5-like isoform X2 [Polyodon spathula]|uniref:PDZ and LIM domain protein 5-like isoform X2 n=1 Tax=Polyodon spathula TaxID=7913 RepID=UPI001B7E1435|nr:PDZ and LIM domain protein 5-like isoform X2 [Polyodon spathula]